VIFEDETYQDDMIQLQMYLAIEQSFGIEFTDTEVSNLETLEELIILIKKKHGRRRTNRR
jgi:acyl carrier protein